MKLLAIDTASHLCSVGIWDSDEGKLIVKSSEDIGTGHAELLMGQVTDCLIQANLTMESIDRFAVSLGPGSFTGVRVGIAAARGFGFSLSKPVIGVTTLQACEALGRQELGSDQKIISLLDARREQVYAQFPDRDPSLLSYVEAAQLLAEKPLPCCGSGAKTYAEVSGSDIQILHSESAFPIEVYENI